MNELFVGEVVHAIADLTAEVEKELRQIQRDIWNSERKGRERERERERERDSSNSHPSIIHRYYSGNH